VNAFKDAVQIPLTASKGCGIAGMVIGIILVVVSVVIGVRAKRREDPSSYRSLESGSYADAQRLNSDYGK
jgi:hypothetical protein